MFDFAQFIKLKDANQIISVVVNGDTATVTMKQWDMGVQIENAVSEVNISEIQNQVTAAQNSITALQDCIANAQAFFSFSEI